MFLLIVIIYDEKNVRKLIDLYMQFVLDIGFLVLDLEKRNIG